MNKKHKKMKSILTWYSFIIVSLAVLLVFYYFPTFRSAYYSLTNMQTYGMNYEYVGLANYKMLLTSSKFLDSLKNTFLLSVYSLINIPLGFLLACGINSLGRTKKQTFFRVMYYIPSIITGVSVVMILQYVLKGHGGLLNTILSFFLGREITIGWLSDVNLSHIGATIMDVWMRVGYFMLMCLASLQAIPTEIYDAASVDGAKRFQKLVYITVPQMKSCFSFLLITCMINGFARFTDLYVIGGNSTAGSPSGTLKTLLMYIYEYSFYYPQYGVASAGAIILAILTMVLTIVNIKLSGFFKEDER